MKEKDLFIEWYKKRFEGLNATPPEEVWKNIEQDLEVNNWYTREFEKLSTAPPEEVWKNIEQNLEVNNWYTKEFEKLNVTPPPEVWESISENLNINEAWKNIESTLDGKQKRRTALRRASLAGLLLLILFASGYFLLNENKNFIGKKFVFYADPHTAKVSEHQEKTFIHFSDPEKENKSTGNINTTSENKIQTMEAVTETPSKSLSIPQKGITSSRTPMVVFQNTKDRKEEPPVPVIDPRKETTPVSNTTSHNTTQAISDELEANTFFQLPVKSISFVVIPPDLSIIPFQLITDSAIADKKPEAGAYFRGLYAGGVYSYNNIWLLNNQTFNGFKSTSLDQTNINSGNSYGIAVGYGLNNSWATELNVYLNSHQGQTYHVYEEGRYLSKNVSLNYTIFNLSIKQRKAGFTKFKKLLRSNGLIAGINFGYLRSANNIYTGRTEVVRDNYRVADFGLRLGYGYELLMFRKIILSGCLQTNIGLNNIYSGTNLIPGNFNRTHTACIGAELGIKYLLK